MNTQTLDLNRMGLTAMNEFEMMEIDGGSFWKWLEGIGVAALAIGITIGSGGLATGGAIAIVVGYIGEEGI